MVFATSRLRADRYNGMLVHGRSSVGLRQLTGEYRLYQQKVNVDMLNAIKNALADVLSFSPSSE